jgi:hypothetical protein
MSEKRKGGRRFIELLLFWSVIVHALFVWQMVIALSEKTLFAPEFLKVFILHALLIYFLPPAYPILPDGINYWGVIWKAFDAIPASLLYGAIIAFVFEGLFRAIDIARTFKGTTKQQ